MLLLLTVLVQPKIGHSLPGAVEASSLSLVRSVDQVVYPADPNDRLSASCSPPSLAVGSNANCTATVTGSSPTGVVEWTNTSLGRLSQSSCTLSAGSCQIMFTPTGLPGGVGPALLYVSYAGDANNAPASTTTSVYVYQDRTTTSVSCTPSPAIYTLPTTCTASVTGYFPSGWVVWSSSAAPDFTSGYQCILSAGSCSVSYTPRQTPSTGSLILIGASYPGDSNNQGSSGNFTLSVPVPASTNTIVSCSPTRVVVNHLVLCTAAVKGNSTSGTVSWGSSNLADTIGTCTLSSGSCSVSYTPPFSGKETITAAYRGDPNNAVSLGSFLLTVGNATATSTTSSTSKSTSTSSSNQGGVPEFSFQLGFTLLAIVVIVASYVVVRRIAFPRGDFRHPLRLTAISTLFGVYRQS